MERKEVKTESKSMDSVEFYDLMQNYRIASIEDQQTVAFRFIQVKAWIDVYAEQEKKNAHDELVETLKDMMFLHNTSERDLTDEWKIRVLKAKEALKKATE